MCALYKESILVVDDVEDSVDLLVEVLGKNYNVSVCLDGETALQTVAKTRPDLILLDVMMPRMDGFEVCKRLKANAETSTIPVIFLSADDDQQSKIKALAMGGVDYISKPFHAGEVRARVETHLEFTWIRREFEDTLSRTITGTIRLLSEILAMMNPELALFSAWLHKGMKAQCRAHDLEPAWCYELAGMLMPVGMLPIAPCQLAAILSGAPLNAVLMQRFDVSAAQSALLLARIPQLEHASETIRLSALKPQELLGDQCWDALENMKKAALILRLLRESARRTPEFVTSASFVSSRLYDLYGIDLAVASASPCIVP